MKEFNQLSDSSLHSISEIYQENSKLRAHDINLFGWIQYVNSDPTIRNIISRFKPLYSEGLHKIELTKVFQKSTFGIEQIVSARRSIRTFSGGALTLETISKILFLSGGITETLKYPDGSTWDLRAAPSPGGLFPIDVFSLIFDVHDVTPGVYYYNPKEHALVLVQETEVSELKATILKASPAIETTISTCSVCILLASRMKRLTFKYGERGYRFMLLEAGHIAQNILLLATAEELGAVPIAGFLDDEINNFMDFNGVDVATQYLIPIGNMK